MLLILSLCIFFVLKIDIRHGSEMRMLREQEAAMNKLKDRKARFEMRLNETQRIVTEFKNRERMSDAPQYVEVFDQLKKRVEEFIAEVH